jgi:hypothetical protein
MTAMYLTGIAQELQNLGTFNMQSTFNRYIELVSFSMLSSNCDNTTSKNDESLLLLWWPIIVKKDGEDQAEVIVQRIPCQQSSATTGMGLVSNDYLLGSCYMGQI